MKCKIYFYFIICSLLFHFPIFSQPTNISLNRDVLELYDKFGAVEHSAIKPYLYTEVKTTNSEKQNINSELLPFFLKTPFSKFARFDTPQKVLLSRAVFNISPIADFNAGYQLNTSQLKNYLGGGACFQFTNYRFHVQLNAYTASADLPNYADSVAKYTAIIPGWGRAYPTKNGYSMQKLWGYVSVSPNKIFNLQLGNDKNFIGDGYRSLFLSDAAAPYPFFKISTKIWKLKYQSLFAWQQDITAPSKLKSDTKNKFGTFHFLSWNATRWLNLNIFESVVWQGKDTNRVRNFDVNYLNPVAFFRPIEYSLGSSDNAFLGFGCKVKFNRNNHLYGQLMLDEFYLPEIKARRGWWANKQAVQMGFKTENLFKIKNLAMRTEVNVVRPYMYAHGSVQQNYGQLNQSLAHPLGANFYEGIGILTYRYKNILMEGKLIYAAYGADSAGENMGRDIFQSYITRPHEFGNELTQGVKTNLIIAGLRCAYMIKPEWGTQFEAGCLFRTERNEQLVLNTAMVYIGFKSRLWTEFDSY
jgi:hypothetical protein